MESHRFYLIIAFCIPCCLQGSQLPQQVKQPQVQETMARQADEQLLDATKAGNDEEIISALGSGANIEVRDARGNTPLLVAIKSLHPQTAQLLIQRGADVNAANLNKDTPLMLAADRGYLEIVKELLPKTNVNAANKKGETALIYATDSKHLAIVHELLTYGANINLQNNSGSSALDVASQNNVPLLIEELLTYSGPIHAIILQNALKIAKFYNHTKVIKLIEERQLLEAAVVGDETEVIALLDKGANINTTWNAQGNTPLMLAIINKHTKVAELLINRGAALDIKNDKGNTALTLALLHFKPGNDRLELAKKLLEHGADVNARDGKSQTALIFAADEGDLQMVEELLKHGADRFITSKLGATALWTAQAKGHKEIVNLLESEKIIKPKKLIQPEESLLMLTSEEVAPRESLRKLKPETFIIKEAPAGKLKYD